MKVLSVQYSPVRCSIASLRPVFKCGKVKRLTVCRHAPSQDICRGKGRCDILIPPRMTSNKYGVKMLIFKPGNVVQCECHSYIFFCSVLDMIGSKNFREWAFQSKLSKRDNIVRGNLLSGRETVSFLRRNLFHGVSYICKLLTSYDDSCG